MDEKEVQQHIEKIEKLINSADKFNEVSFRMVLEGLVSKVGEEAEYFLVHQINNDKLDIITRVNIVRVAGYIHSPHFLVPLKKIIDTDENIQLRKEAIISVSKYNDQRALNILNQAITNIKNPQLQETIKTEISKIKRNNPVFGLLPRFLEGEKNPEEFQVTMGILKRILTPTDAPMFAAYLNCGKRFIEEGAFEILCFTADEKLQEPILSYFQDRFDEFSGSSHLQEQHTQEQEQKEKKEKGKESEGESESERFYLLVSKLKYYFTRNPSLIDGQLENLGTQLLYIKDTRIRNLFISIICRSQQPAGISFVGGLYDSVPALRETIINEYSGNEAALDLLFEKYQTAGEDLKGLLIRSLLNCRKGLDYFYLHFSSLEAKEKEIIVKYLPYGGSHELSGFFTMIFQSDQLELKTVLLTKIKEYYEFSVKDILFDPAWERKFSLMEQEYLDTITQLFPVTSVKKLMGKIIDMDLSTSKVKNYLKKIKDMVAPGFAFVIKDKNFITLLFNKIIQFNNPDLGGIFLSILKDIKTIDLQTYYNLHESLGLFTAQSERKISPREVEELRNARKNLNDLYYEIRRIEDGLKSLDRLFAREVPDIEQITDFLNHHWLCVALHIRQISQMIKEHLQAAKPEVLRQWIQLLSQFPGLGFQVKDVILAKIQHQQSPLKPLWTKLYDALPREALKIVICLTNRSVTAVLREQCHELIPIVPISTNVDDWQQGDILLCDPDTLNEFILKNTIPSKKLFLLLDKPADFSSYKSYNLRPLVKPLSAYRMMKEILKELFL
ncbi:MAG: HEAT repeat domain-containing protein [Candidatus Aminicenantes bacterium]|nr:MAG: HEAT repeat domain-containing protein [Candidatus Aminicenantes bacterium]